MRRSTGTSHVFRPGLRRSTRWFVAAWLVATDDDIHAADPNHPVTYRDAEDPFVRLHGVRAVRARETIRPITLTRPVARLLGVRAGTAAFAVERQTFGHDGPIEWQESVVRGDRYLYSVDLPRRP